MKDHSKKAGTAHENDDTATHVALPSNVATFPHDDSPTDANLRQLDLPTLSGAASSSLGRLEKDLRRLQLKWRAVEHDISERDDKIEDLAKALQQEQEQSESLRTKLDEADRKKQSLDEELQSASAEIETWKNAGAESERQLSAFESNAEQTRQDIDALKKQKQALADELDGVKANISDDAERTKQLGSRNRELRIHVQELQDYIDGRKSDWDTLKQTLSDYEDTIAGMTEELSSVDAVMIKKEDEKAELAERILDLERDLATLKGRHEERELSHAQLQTTLNDQSRELGSLNKEALRLQKTIDRLEGKLERRDKTVSKLRTDLKEAKRLRSTLETDLGKNRTAADDMESRLDEAKAVIAKLEEERESSKTAESDLRAKVDALESELSAAEPTLADRDSNIADLESELAKRKSIASELKDEIERAQGDLASAREDAAQFEIRAIELEAVVLETSNTNAELEAELEAQRELIELLEKELSSKQANLDVLDRSADRLSAISGGIRDLDFLLDDHLSPEQKDASDDDMEDDVLIEPDVLLGEPDTSKHVIISIGNDGEETRYSLSSGTTTIGRSRKSDIQLDSKYISRIHARIIVRGSTVTIEDAGSTNGFLVNTQQKNHHTLSHGDDVEIGTDRLRYLCESPQPDIAL